MIFLSADMEVLKWILLVPVSLIISLTIVAFIIRLVKIKKDDNKRKEKIKNENISTNLELVEYYGGSDNIINVDVNMSRVSVEVKTIELVNANAIKEYGAKNVLLVGNTVKASFGDRSSYIYKALKGENYE